MNNPTLLQQLDDTITSTEVTLAELRHARSIIVMPAPLAAGLAQAAAPATRIHWTQTPAGRAKLSRSMKRMHARKAGK